MEYEKKKYMLKDQVKKTGILRFAPCWVARNFMLPGKRLKLHPADIYAMGAEKGGIDERWFASTTPADNGKYTVKNEGLSSIVMENGNDIETILFKDAIDIMGDEIIGKEMMSKYGKWMMYAKFFDNMGPISHHVHLTEEYARNVGALGKTEAYYFPAQLNYIENNFPHTYFGLEPGTSKEQVINCLKSWGVKGDTGILELSKAYKITPGTGWDLPAGILHAPGSLLTYEPQRASDVSIFFQSMVEGRFNGRDTLEKDIPKDKYYDYDYFISILDWEANVDPEFKKKHFHAPVPVEDIGRMEENGYHENWIAYGCPDFCAKELTVFPGKTVKIKDCAAYGLIMLQGHGTINGVDIETPAMIRYGQLTSDEMFVTFAAANESVTITNTSSCDNIVMLKHFGPDNIDAVKFIDG